MKRPTAIMTKREAEAVLEKYRRGAKEPPTPEQLARFDQRGDRAAKEARDAGLTMDEFADSVLKEFRAIKQEAIRLIMQGYPPDIAVKEACGLYANTKL